MLAECGCEIGWMCVRCCGRPTCSDPILHIGWDAWGPARIAHCGRDWFWWNSEPYRATALFIAARNAWEEWHRRQVNAAFEAWHAQESRLSRLRRISRQYRELVPA